MDDLLNVMAGLSWSLASMRGWAGALGRVRGAGPGAL